VLTRVEARLPQGGREVDDRFDDFFDPAAAAVVSIDMIRSHLAHPTDCPCPAGERGISSIGRTDAFHRAARELGIPIIHTRSVLRRDTPDDPRGNRATWRRLLEWQDEANPLLDQHVVEDTSWIDFVTEVDERDLIVHKKRLSGFAATDLDFLLRNLGKRIVVITGIFMDACDLSTASAAADLDYKVLTLSDVVVGSTPEMERAALDIFASYIGLVVASADLVGEWNARIAANQTNEVAA
jgi:nicotinamidase-related amidase